MKGASVDLTHTDCDAGTVRRLSFADLAAMVHVVSDRPETLDLYVFRSVGNYVRQFLDTACQPGRAPGAVGTGLGGSADYRLPTTQSKSLSKPPNG